jgi:hypothetical protein
VRLSFSWGAFGIEGMGEEKMFSTSFGAAASHEERAPGDGAAHARTPSAWVARPLRMADLNATWHLGMTFPSARICPRIGAAQPPLGARIALTPRGISHCYYNIVTYNKNSIIYTTTNNIFSIHTINYK